MGACRGYDENLVLSEHRNLDKLMQEPKRGNTPNIQGAFKRMVLGELQKYPFNTNFGKYRRDNHMSWTPAKSMISEGNWGLKVSSNLRLSFWSDFDSRPTVEIRPQTQLESAYSIHTGGFLNLEFVSLEVNFHEGLINFDPATVTCAEPLTELTPVP
ncbi:hypothetical protein C8J57DRAFT_1243822 [Mycena rebaudengoi]|nr:hypothetical protein C8J57DRAFT_1243822 [Mycena rebaudengoi]